MPEGGEDRPHAGRDKEQGWRLTPLPNCHTGHAMLQHTPAPLSSHAPQRVPPPSWRGTHQRPTPPAKPCRGLHAMQARLSGAAFLPAVHPARRGRPRLKLAAPAPEKISLKETARRCNDVLAIWRLCGRNGCMENGACGGDPFDCMSRCLPQVPQASRQWFTCIGIAQERGLTLREALAWCDNVGAETAFAEWYASILAMLPACRRRVRPRVTDR